MAAGRSLGLRSAAPMLFASTAAGAAGNGSYVCPPPPALSDKWVTANLAALFVLVSVIVLCAGIWVVMLRGKEPRLMIRSIRVQIMIWIGALCIPLAVCLPRAFPGKVPCAVPMTLYFVVCQLITGAAAARLLAAAYQDRRTKQALAWSDNSLSESSEEGLDQQPSDAFITTFAGDFFEMIYNKNAASRPDALSFFREAAGTNAWQVVAVISLPMIIAIVCLLVFITPYHTAGCYNCPFYG